MLSLSQCYFIFSALHASEFHFPSMRGVYLIAVQIATEQIMIIYNPRVSEYPDHEFLEA